MWSCLTLSPYVSSFSNICESFSHYLIRCFHLRILFRNLPFYLGKEMDSLNYKDSTNVNPKHNDQFLEGNLYLLAAELSAKLIDLYDLISIHVLIMVGFQDYR